MELRFSVSKTSAIWAIMSVDRLSSPSRDVLRLMSWLIMVDCNRNILAVYHGSQNNWVPYDSWQVTTGAPETPTIKGEFEVGDRGYAFGDSEYTCYWYTQIYGGYLFHSILYNKDDTVRDGRLGLHLSHGCVRNPIERAKWIYDNIPSGTKVVTYPF